uniref:LRAT domain-containing protein n=1 Tax=Gadus morhua TaxID=8049 RepID=A0A8C5AFT0_GADMO
RASGVKPQPGDLIEIFRGSYQHWAVYIGDGLNPGAGAYSMMSIVCDRARVTWAGFWDVVGTDEWRTNNILDDQCEPRSADLVVQEARRLVGTELPYSVFTSNCKHFATDLRYGKAQSRQLLLDLRAAAIVSVGVLQDGGVTCSRRRNLY